ncbi:hypothetical protein DDB_G0282609 [Dictyostelium discoideum AX4]|uniref:Uncharacterized protein n=1 Tax=Dictyostelium discoideum TaxID=44689 RepID=Q54S86_DICDI|nr:hypothetical protein DDB_G0282609 [Dictyostelium discoideum AX4]EAL66164.1 hypothetical protein DDB_G0282609 [Dictyostelium discoideum AX4]|eukprot:XP_640153.1 hypothetical protein DDB_G0282609 [Dictyostelium discoideum AX4]
MRTFIYSNIVILYFAYSVSQNNFVIPNALITTPSPPKQINNSQHHNLKFEQKSTNQKKFIPLTINNNNNFNQNNTNNNYNNNPFLNNKSKLIDSQ